MNLAALALDQRDEYKAAIGRSSQGSIPSDRREFQRGDARALAGRRIQHSELGRIAALLAFRQREIENLVASKRPSAPKSRRKRREHTGFLASRQRQSKQAFRVLFRIVKPA